ncbi:MAG: hypothetical protein ACKPKO_59990, partial [Candidatus Fonsibacter sp.]
LERPPCIGKTLKHMAPTLVWNGPAPLVGTVPPPWLERSRPLGWNGPAPWVGTVPPRVCGHAAPGCGDDDDDDDKHFTVQKHASGKNVSKTISTILHIILKT